MRATGALGWVLAAAAATLAGAACGRGRFEGGGDLRAKRVVLEREVEGLPEVAARLERGEPFLPSDDVVISIDAALVRELIVAQLPFDMEVDRFHLRLSESEPRRRRRRGREAAERGRAMSARVPATLLLAASLAAFGAGCRRERAAPEQIQAEIDALEKERAVLRGRIDELVVNDPRRKSMPKAPVRVGVPTALARDLVEKVARGFVDQVALDLRNLKVRKKGTVRKVVTLGEYELKVDIARAYGRLKTGRPDVRFGGNKVSLALPVAIASGEGRATLGFKWDGKNVSDAVCGDLEVTQEVSGRIKPDTYPVGGSLVLQATAREILATPHFPPTRIKLRIDPSAESWAAVQKILDVRGQTVELEIKVSALAITEDVIWLGADLKLDLPKLQALVAQPAGESSTPLPPATAPPAAR